MITANRCGALAKYPLCLEPFLIVTFLRSRSYLHRSAKPEGDKGEMQINVRHGYAILKVLWSTRPAENVSFGNNVASKA